MLQSFSASLMVKKTAYITYKDRCFGYKQLPSHFYVWLAIVAAICNSAACVNKMFLDPLKLTLCTKPSFERQLIPVATSRAIFSCLSCLNLPGFFYPQKKCITLLSHTCTIQLVVYFLYRFSLSLNHLSLHSYIL